jgi:hypothetical protein
MIGLLVNNKLSTMREEAIVDLIPGTVLEVAGRD